MAVALETSLTPRTSPSPLDSSQSAPAQLPEQTLSQSDFLQLLVTQLSSQDPMNPVSDAQFIGQMAQFSTLEATQTMQETVAGLQASSLLGQTIQVQNAQGQSDTGAVSSVLFQSGSPEVIVNGQPYNLDQILSISQTQPHT
ncbi:MAG: flagellar hook capping FlgD N-terminal domain-containing protein [Verrucomicrobiota bacterium]|jgi:flagellar basal-body rod modification protein FlgD